MSRPWLVLTGILGALAVLLGAFGAHALRFTLPLQAITIYQTGVQYLQIHVLALLGTALLMAVHPNRGHWLRWAAGGFVAGCILFSGSLVALALTGIPWLGAITPVGGVAWVAAWLVLAGAYHKRETA